MAIADDVSVAANGDIRYTGASTNYTVLELHRFLQDLADNASSSGDDLLDITDVTPSDRSTDNIISLLGTYNIDDTLAQHLYDGSISQSSGAEVYSGLKVLGAVNNTSTTLQIIQNNTVLTAFWGSQASGGLNGDALSGVLMRCLIKSRTGGTDIDGKRIRVQARHWGDTYSFFNVTLGQGESVAAVSTTPDAQNTSVQGTVTAYTHVTNTEGFQTIDLNNGNGARDYYSQWTYGANTSGDKLKGIWEFGKDLVGTGTAKLIHGINGALFLGITHSFAYDTEATGPFVEDETLSWGTGVTAGTGLLLALDDQGVVGNMYIQLLTGVIPSDNVSISGGTSLATCLVNGGVVSKTVPQTFLGSYTGTIIGAYGVGLASSDLTASDSIQDLTSTTQVPPNNVTFSVTSVVSGEDYILVGPETAGSIDEAQLSVSGAQTAGASTLTVASIPADTPNSGTIRVFNGTNFDRIPYTSHAGTVFTLTGTLPNNVSNLAGGYVSYIDKLADASSVSFTTVFSSARPIFIRVRDGGGTPIKTFETPATLTSAGGSVAAIRTSDS